MKVTWGDTGCASAQSCSTEVILTFLQLPCLYETNIYLGEGKVLLDVEEAGVVGLQFDLQEMFWWVLK